MIKIQTVSWCSIGLIMTCLIAWSNADENQPQAFPNIILILADDLGYGDVSCYNSEAKVKTSNIDDLASQGMMFTDAHSPSTVCTPTRYGILTGRMAFRTGKKGVFTGAGGPCMIEERRNTIPKMLKQRGYRTACIGKWHLGMTFLDEKGNRIENSGIKGVKRIDFSRPIPDGPIHRGFDTFFGTACCPTTDFLYAYIDGDRVPVAPTKMLDKKTIPKHAYSNDCRNGMIAENFKHDEVDMVFLEKSIEFLEDHKKRFSKQPFFLFHSMQAVHLPSLAAKPFRGKSGAGPHGDFILQMDYMVGELLKTLDRLEFRKNTLVVFTSDNGPEVPTIKNMRKVYNHDGARPWRGVKRDQWEGGHRVPFIVTWPNKVKPGEQSRQLLSQTDLMASFADIVDLPLSNECAEDSISMLPVLVGKNEQKSVREYMLQETWTLKMSLRNGDWKYIDHRGSGGNNYSNSGEWGMKCYAIEDLVPNAPAQLYNLLNDPRERKNLFFQEPELAAKLKAKLELFKKSGRSVPIR